MARASTLENLATAIRIAAKEAPPNVPSVEIAREFYANERDLIEPFIADWIIHKLAVMIGKHRAKARREANPQLSFEGFLGFTRLPATYRAEDGDTVRRPDFTINVYRKIAARMRAEESPALKQVNEAIALMAKYTTRDKDIKWAEVVKRECARNREPRG